MITLQMFKFTIVFVLTVRGDISLGTISSCQEAVQHAPAALLLRPVLSHGGHHQYLS